MAAPIVIDVGRSAHACSYVLAAFCFLLAAGFCLLLSAERYLLAAVCSLVFAV
jgi:hypothetical protein